METIADAMLELRCPQCSTKLRGSQKMMTATTACQRTCQKCHTRWRLTITPNNVETKIGTIGIDRIEWLAINNNKKR